MPKLSDLKVKIFADGAAKADIVEMAAKPWIAGFTTNPSLLKKAGVKDYEAFARDVVAAVPDRHISFEVFSDDIAEMVAQARVIATWGKNVYVKLPVTNTQGEPLFDAVRSLSSDGVNINMTAIFTWEQVEKDDQGARRAGAGLRVGVRRTARRFRRRLPAADAGFGQARAQDEERRDHLGLDPRSVQRDRSRRHGLPHHHGAERRAARSCRRSVPRPARSCRAGRCRRSAKMQWRRG